MCLDDATGGAQVTPLVRQTMTHRSKKTPRPEETLTRNVKPKRELLFFEVDDPNDPRPPLRQASLFVTVAGDGRAIVRNDDDDGGGGDDDDLVKFAKNEKAASDEYKAWKTRRDAARFERMRAALCEPSTKDQTVALMAAEVEKHGRGYDMYSNQANRLNVDIARHKAQLERMLKKRTVDRQGKRSQRQLAHMAQERVFDLEDQIEALSQWPNRESKRTLDDVKNRLSEVEKEEARAWERVARFNELTSTTNEAIDTIRSVVAGLQACADDYLLAKEHCAQECANLRKVFAAAHKK